MQDGDYTVFHLEKPNLINVDFLRILAIVNVEINGKLH